MDRWQAGGMTSFSQTCFSEYWSSLPKLAPDDDDDAKPNETRADHASNKTSTTKIVVVDPWDFGHRMALGKRLIERGPGGERVWGRRCARHFFWGYLAQLDWQRRSGRFQNPSTWTTTTTETSAETWRTENAISERSWWGYANLQFVVAAYVGAAEAGAVSPAVSLSDKSVADDPGYRESVECWRRFFANDLASFLSDDTSSLSETEMYQALWREHSRVINVVLRCGDDLLKALPEADRDLGLGWCNMVEMFAASNWQLLSLDALLEFGVGYLPSVRLTDDPGAVERLAPKELVNAETLRGMKNVSESSMRRTCRFLARVSRWAFVRREFPRTLYALTFGSPLRKMATLLYLVLFASLPCPASWR